MALIVGDGDIASVLPDREDRLYFASGVSNSQETRRAEYEREEALLLKQSMYRHLIYFSSLSVFYADTLYAQHKKHMERVVKENFKHWTIIRIGNISWGTNPNTLINYLRAHPEAEIQHVYRYVVSKEEFLYWIGMIPFWNVEMNVPGERLKVAQIAERIKKGLL